MNDLSDKDIAAIVEKIVGVYFWRPILAATVAIMIPTVLLWARHHETVAEVRKVREVLMKNREAIAVIERSEATLNDVSRTVKEIREWKK